jgi:hypothetical protein
MLKLFLITLLLLFAAPAKAQSVERSFLYGKMLGAYYCYALAVGITDTKEFLDLIEDRNPEFARDLAEHNEHSKINPELLKAFARGTQAHTNLHCREEFDRYLKLDN